MRKHTKIYLKWTRKHKNQEPHELICELCHRNKVVDIHHINPRGMGGNPSGEKDCIENLMGLCRVCHNQVEFTGLVSKEAQIHQHEKWMHS
ncbi:MAG: hypothetical protein CBD11_01890 [Phycisphaera sp. TMED151]|nr:MAG: hypothetical protein CBD11_01890 [Phycisphaera sp. TMED151]